MLHQLSPTARLNSFARAHEYACRRSEAGDLSLVIVRTGLAIQPFRVTTTPRPTDQIMLSFAE